MCCGTASHHGGQHRGYSHACSCGCGRPSHFGEHHQFRGHNYGHSCSCGGLSHFQRRFPTQKEKLAWLEQYLENLREEAKGVEEHIAKMKEK